MSVILIDLADGGVRIRGVRVLSSSDDDSWRPSPDTPMDNVPTDAAAWIARQLELIEAPEVRSVCIDAGQSRCHWLSAPSSDPRVLRGAITQQRPSAWGDWGGSEGIDAEVSPLEASATTLEALAAPDREPGSERDGAITIPDAAARVLVDELDQLGVPVERVGSLWHHLARAWDPGARPARNARAGTATEDGSADDSIEAQSPTTAVVMVELASDGKRRVVWTWSDAGRLLAAGIARPGPGPIGGSIEALAGRLSSDWLAWGAQIGASPARLVLLIDERLEGAERGPLARAAERLAPHATVDAISLNDPVAHTLRRISERVSKSTPDAREAIQSLSTRPGKIHRATHRWLTLGLATVAFATLMYGFRLHSRAGDLRQSGADAQAEWRNQLAADLPAIATDPFPEILLNDEVSQLRRQLDLVLRGRQDGRPILAEFDTVAFVLASEPDMILLDAFASGTTGVTISVLAPSIESAEILPELFNGASANARYTGRFVERNSGRANLYRNRADHKQYELQGTWVDRQPAATGGGA